MKTIDNFLQEGSRWKKEVIGDLSDKGVKRLQKAGLGKPKNVYLKSFHSATLGQLKQMGAHVTNVLPPGLRFPPGQTPPVFGYIDTTGKKFIYIDKNISQRSNLLYKELRKHHLGYKWSDMKVPILRHELDEIKSGARIFSKMKDPTKFKAGFFVTKGKAEEVGHHVSPEVLRREKDYLRFMDRYYGTGTSLSRYRKFSGEDKIANLPRKKIKDLEKKIIKNLKVKYNISYDKLGPQFKEKVQQRLRMLWGNISDPIHDFADEHKMDDAAKNIADRIAQTIKANPYKFAAAGALALTAAGGYYLNKKRNKEKSKK